MSAVSTPGIDLAKDTFSVHGVDAEGVVTVRRTVSRAKLGELVARLPPCLIGTVRSTLATGMTSTSRFMATLVAVA